MGRNRSLESDVQRMVKQLGLLLCAFALVSAACASVASEVGATPEDESLIGCPSGPWFPRSALDNHIDLASSGRNDIIEAVSPFLDSEEGEFWPQRGWRILHADDDNVLLVHLEPPDRLSFMTVENTGGSWKWTGAQAGAACPLVLKMAEGLNIVEWRLDPGESPTPDSTSLRLLLQERECVSGQEIGDRLVGPEIVYTEDAVLVSFAAEPPPGDAFNCQGNPETSYVLVLDEPLGERELADGRDTGMSLENVIG